MLSNRFRLAAALTFLIGTGTHAPAGEEYYLAMFGSQRTPANPDYTHSWATFVRMSWDGDGPCPQNAHIEANTISWLPVNTKVRVGALLPEPGYNFNLHPTFDI